MKNLNVSMNNFMLKEIYPTHQFKNGDRDSDIAGLEVFNRY